MRWWPSFLGLAMGASGFSAAAWIHWSTREAALLHARERETFDAIRQDMLAEHIESQRQCRAEKEGLIEEQRARQQQLEDAWREREQIRVASMKLELEKARLAGAESILKASKDPSASNPLLKEIRDLRAEIEQQQLRLAEADRQLAAAMTQIDELDKEKRKLARALDAANLSVAEAAAAQSTAEIETKRARERVVEAEWERFTLETVQTACWNGLEKRRTRCKEEVNTALLSAKVDWLICRLEKNAKPFLQKAPFDRPPTSSSRLLLSDGNASSWLVLCDRDLRDGGTTPGTP